MSERTDQREPQDQREHQDQVGRQKKQARRRDAPRWLWFGVLGGPIAWAVHEVAAWLFVELTCVEGHDRLLGLSLTTVVVLSTVIPLVVAALSWIVAVGALRSLRRVLADRDPGDAPRRLPRARFMAQLGAWMAGLSILMILYDAAAVATFPACAR